LDRTLKGFGRKTIDRRFACRQREEPRVSRVADRVPHRRIARAEGRRCDLAPPCERCPRWFRRRAHERAAPDIAAQQALRLEFAVRAHDSRPADPKTGRQLTLWRELRSRWQIAPGDRRFQQLHEMRVQRPGVTLELTLDLLNHSGPPKPLLCDGSTYVQQSNSALARVQSPPGPARRDIWKGPIAPNGGPKLIAQRWYEPRSARRGRGDEPSSWIHRPHAGHPSGGR